MLQRNTLCSDFGEYLIMPKHFSFNLSRTLRKKFTSSPEWILDMGIYKRENCKQIFMNAIEIRAISIYLGYNMTSSLLHEIKQTPFTRLKQLWFSQNQIQSIEMICRLKSPFLEEIWFRENLIITIKALRKAYWPAMNTISLYNNLISDIQLLNQFHSPNLHTLWIQYQKEEIVQGNNLCWISKLETTNLSSLCIGSQYRLEQAKLASTVIKKFNKKELRFFKNEEY